MDKKLRSKLKLKKRNFNPVTSYIILTIIVIVFSGILSLFNFQTTYNVVDSAKVEIKYKDVEDLNRLLEILDVVK